MNVYQKLEELGLKLPNPPARGGAYCPARVFNGNLVYISGCGPVIGEPITGRLGAEISLEKGKELAKNCALNVLAVLQAEIGDLNRVKSIPKTLCFVSSSNDFYSQPAVANGATELFAALFGEKAGLPTRSAIGVNVLPGNIPVELEALFELEA